MLNERRTDSMINFTIESNENFAMIRNRDGDPIRHATEYEEQLWLLLNLKDREAKAANEFSKKISEESQRTIEELKVNKRELRFIYDATFNKLLEANSEISRLNEQNLQLHTESNRLQGKIKEAWEACEFFYTGSSEALNFEEWNKEHKIDK